ncbi:DMT family transporter [Bifidobacterium moukalabense]|uniref:Membrane protein n=1 Tax=Bifidobacterium moukalabense DSM 27321 TaxID=1435051 RepID=W4N892_9BIFI|nr:DMT family transporter [Bifidobacterium moukalabense]ETY71264.1 membrane protein [Bifidobacterium moukalabense DSM 27321]
MGEVSRGAEVVQLQSEGITVSRPVARVMMLVNAIVWGTGYTMLKHAQDTVPTQWLMFFRMGAATLLMAVVFLHRLRRIRLRRYVVPGLILALTYWMGFLFQLKGLETTSPGRNSFFTDTYCVMVPFIVWAFTRRRPSWQHLVAAFVCAFGIGLVSLSGGGGAELMHMSFGDTMTIIGAFFFALNLVLVGFMGKGFDAIALMLMEFFWCTALFGSGAVLFEGGPSVAWARWDIVLCIGYLVIGSTVIAQVFQTIAVQNLPTSEASVILSTECIFAMLVSVLFAGERLTLPSVCGFALIFGAILLSEVQLPAKWR